MKYDLLIVQYLNEEYEKKKLNNKQFSKRAFARTLGLPSPYLLRIMKGEIPPTVNFILRVAPLLKICESDVNRFVQDLVDNRSKIESSWYNKCKIEKVEDEDHLLVSIARGWYFSIIIELSRLDDFELCSEYIVSKINISKEEAEYSIKFLCDSGFFLCEDEVNRKKLIGDYITFSGKYSSELAIILKERHRKLIKEIDNSIDNVPKDKRLLSSFTIALDTELLPQINERTNEFRKQLIEFIEKESVRKNDVYDYSISFIPLLNSFNCDLI